MTEKKHAGSAQTLAELTCELTRVCASKDEQFASKHNLSPAEFRCMKLFSNEESLSIKEITRLMNLTPGRITHILNSLEKKGYIIRRHEANDKRTITVFPTKESRVFIDDVMKEHIALHAKLLKKFNTEEKDQLLQSLTKLITVIREVIL